MRHEEYTLPLSQKDCEYVDCMISLNDKDIERMNKGINIVFELERSGYRVVSLITTQGLKAKLEGIGEGS